jgi:hypothetical protein
VNAAGGLAGDAAFAESSERLRLLAPAAPCRRLLLLLPAEDAVVAEAPVAHARLRRRRVAVVVRAVPIRAGRTYIIDYYYAPYLEIMKARRPFSRTRRRTSAGSGCGSGRSGRACRRSRRRRTWSTRWCWWTSRMETLASPVVD